MGIERCILCCQIFAQNDEIIPTIQGIAHARCAEYKRFIALKHEVKESLEAILSRLQDNWKQWKIKIREVIKEIKATTSLESLKALLKEKVIRLLEKLKRYSYMRRSVQEILTHLYKIAYY
jgi:hypothetical protein